MKSRVKEILEQKGLIILDGAMATELERNGLNLNNELWSAKVLAEQPEAIKKVHYDYFVHGADAGLSASYQASIIGYIKKGYSQKEAEAMIARSMEILLEARQEWWEKEGRLANRVLPIAIGSIGPYGAYLADGSEYTGNYDVSEDELEEFHTSRIKILKEAGAELFGLETFPSLKEAILCAKILEKMEADYYISFSFKDSNHTNGGNSIIQCVEALREFNYLVAVGVNCTQPVYITNIITHYKKVTDLPIIVYPNSGETYDATDKAWHGEKVSKTYAEWSKEWYDAGASIIGGCCRTTPDDIFQLFTWYNSDKSL